MIEALSPNSYYHNRNNPADVLAAHVRDYFDQQGIEPTEPHTLTRYWGGYEDCQLTLEQRKDGSVVIGGLAVNHAQARIHSVCVTTEGEITDVQPPIQGVAVAVARFAAVEALDQLVFSSDAPRNAWGRLRLRWGAGAAGH